MSARRGRLTSRTAAVAAALLTASIAYAPRADAALLAQASTTGAVTSGIWGTTPTSASVSSAPNCQLSPSWCGPFISTPGALTGSAPVYFNIWNTGSDHLKGLTYTISMTGARGHPNITIAACAVPWASSLSSGPSCSGMELTVLANAMRGSFPATAGVPAQPGGGAYLQATLNRGALTTMTISISVTPADVVPTTTNY